MALFGSKPAQSLVTPAQQLAYSLCYWVDKHPNKLAPPAPWTIAWQPKKLDADYAAVLQNSQTQQYALVVQGTHASKDFDLLEDFVAEIWVNFDPVAGAKVALGAQAGLFNVLIQSGDNTDLASFLQSISGSWTAANPLLVTGHSLGGTLAAMAAMWIGYYYLNNQQPLASLPATIQGITFAAFAAGNQQVADFLNAASNYVPCFNQNDAIPHVWATNTTSNPVFNITNLYALFPKPGPSPMPQGTLQTLIQNKAQQIQQNGISYIQTTGPNSFVFEFKSKDYPIKSKNDWDLEAGYQHNTAYDKTFLPPGTTQTTSEQSEVA